MYTYIGRPYTYGTILQYVPYAYGPIYRYRVEHLHLLKLHNSCCTFDHSVAYVKVMLELYYMVTILLKDSLKPTRAL